MSGSRRPWVQEGLVIDDKDIVVMAVAKPNLQEPPPVDLPVHGQGVSVPIVEVAGQVDAFGAGGGAVKVHRLGHPLFASCDPSSYI